MPIRIGINGFGRMGRLALRAGWGRPDLQFVQINEIAGGPEAAAHLLTFDSVHGRWPHDVESRSEAIAIDGAPIAFSAAAKPGDIVWRDGGVALVVECAGKFRTTDTLPPVLTV